MKLGWFTDIHLDQVDAPLCVAKHIASFSEHFDAAVITGDIANAMILETALSEFASGLGVPTYFVLGNHDYWGGSFDLVHGVARKLSERADLTWLTEFGNVYVGKHTILCGHDGFYDAGWGAPETSDVFMNDWRLIEELRETLETPWHASFPGPAPLVRYLRKMGVDNARAAEVTLRAALEVAEHVIFATHVPPHPFAVRGDKRNEVLPWYTARFMGEMILRVSDDYPMKRITVLSGHVHGRFDEVVGNVHFRTADAEYGNPQIADIIEIGEYFE